MESSQLLARARSHASRIAFRSDAGERSYAELIERAVDIAHALLDGHDDLHEARIAFLLPAGFDYTAVQWAIWLAGGIAVPLSLSSTNPELEYTLVDSQTCCVVTTRDRASQLEPLIQQLDLRSLIVDDVIDGRPVALPTISPDRPCDDSVHQWHN